MLVVGLSLIGALEKHALLIFRKYNLSFDIQELNILSNLLSTTSAFNSNMLGLMLD